MRLAGLIVGVVFGVTLSWTGMSDPDVIRGALLFKESYLFLFFASGVGSASMSPELIATPSPVKQRSVLPSGA